MTKNLREAKNGKDFCPGFKELEGADLPNASTFAVFQASREIAHAVANLDSKLGVTPKALLVGGFVRDRILGKTSLDGDIEVFGCGSDDLKNCLESLFPGQVFLQGERFPVFSINLADGNELQVAPARRKISHPGADNLGTLVDDPLATLEDVALRKDFTVNAIFMDPLTEEIFDPLSGQEDIQLGVLRATDLESSKMHPRVFFRALQLSSRFEFSPEPDTKDQMKIAVISGALDKVDVEISRQQIRKLLLLSEKPSVGFKLMREIGFLARSYPEIEALWGVLQDPKWHPEGDVGTHVMMVLDEGAKIIRRPENNFSEEEKYLIMLACLVHDLGKAVSTRVDKETGKIKSGGHETTGVPIVADVLKRLGISEDLINLCKKFTSEHMKPTDLFSDKEKGKISEEQYVNGIRKMVRGVYPGDWRVFVAFKEADMRGRGKAEGSFALDLAPLDELVKVVIGNGFDKDPTKKLLSGKELLDLGLGPGSEIGDIIRDIEELRDKGGIVTRDDALKKVRQHYFVAPSDMDGMGIPEDRIRGTIRKDLQERWEMGELLTRQAALSYVRGKYVHAV